jgi:hypothetical protein
VSIKTIPQLHRQAILASLGIQKQSREAAHAKIARCGGMLGFDSDVFIRGKLYRGAR